MRGSMVVLNKFMRELKDILREKIAILKGFQGMVKPNVAVKGLISSAKP